MYAPTQRMLATLMLTAIFFVGAQSAHAEMPAKPIQPTPQILLPVELATLSTHLNAHMAFTRFGVSSFSANVFALSIEAQIALLNMLELGINVPFLRATFGDVDNASFGDIQANAKLKLFNIAKMLALAVFANITLPTDSDRSSDARKFAIIHTGVAATAMLWRMTLAATMGALIQVDNTSSSARNVGFYFWDLYAAMMVHSLVAVTMATQMIVPVDPSGDTGFIFAPALRFFLSPGSRFYMDVGARFALTDNFAARLVLFLGRAMLNLNVGFAW